MSRIRRTPVLRAPPIRLSGSSIDEEQDDPFDQKIEEPTKQPSFGRTTSPGMIGVAGRSPSPSPPAVAAAVPSLSRRTSAGEGSASASPPVRRVVGSKPLTSNTNSAMSTTPARSTSAHGTGQAHLAAILQRMGKKLPESKSHSSGTTSSAASTQVHLTSMRVNDSATTATAFDVAMRASLKQEFLKDLTTDNQLLSPSVYADLSPSPPSAHQFLGHDERLTPDDYEADDDEFMEDVSAKRTSLGAASPSSTTSSQLSRKLTQTQSQSTSSSRSQSPVPTAAIATKSTATKANGMGSLTPRTSTSNISSALTSTKSMLQRGGSSTTRTTPPTTSRLTSTTAVSTNDDDDDDDDDPDAPFTFSANGAYAKEQARLAELERRKAASKAVAANMASLKRKRSDDTERPTKKPSPAKPIFKSTSASSSTVAATATAAASSRTKSATVEEGEDDPFAVPIKWTPSPKLAFPQLSPPPTAVFKHKPPVPIPEAEDDPFAVAISPFQSPEPLSTPPPPPTAIVATTNSTASTTLPPQIPTLNRTSSVPLQVAIDTQHLSPKKTTSHPHATQNATITDSNLVCSTAASSLTGVPLDSSASNAAPTLARTSSNELLEQRRANLAQKSHTQLLIEALLGKPSPELKEIESQALTPAQRVLLLKRSSSLTSQPSSYVTLASKIGRKLKPKVGGVGVGYNAKQRARGRRADGFLADMTPVLEKTVEYLLANGADPNGRDADRNHALWLALQLRGSERVVKLLLEKGAECVMAEESEDESTDEEDEKEEGKANINNTTPERPIKPRTDSLRPDLLSQAAANILSPTSTARLAGRDVNGKKKSNSMAPDDPLNFERGSTVDLAMKMGSNRLVLLLLRAGHLPSRVGRIRLMDFAKLHGFAAEASSTLVDHLWQAVQDADPQRVADVLRHMDRKAIDTKDQTGRTPLYCAVEQKDQSIPIIHLLLRCGANPNQTDCSNTPMAVFPLCRQSKKSTDVLSLLVRFGLNPSAEVSDTEQTLIEFATEAAGARTESIQILKQALQQQRQGGGGIVVEKKTQLP